jgi:hypothetical protein
MPSIDKVRSQPPKCYWALLAIFALQIVACAPRPIPETLDWWKHASNAQIADITYRTFCAPEPMSCFPLSDYSIDIGKDTKLGFLAVHFMRDDGRHVNAISCHTVKRKLVLSCSGTARTGGRYLGMKVALEYPIIWPATPAY